MWYENGFFGVWAFPPSHHTSILLYSSQSTCMSVCARICGCCTVVCTHDVYEYSGLTLIDLIVMICVVAMVIDLERMDYLFFFMGFACWLKVSLPNAFVGTSKHCHHSFRRIHSFYLQTNFTLELFLSLV